MTPAHLRVGDDALHAAIDHGFYARPATFYRVYEDMFAAAQGPYLDQGHAYFPCPSTTKTWSGPTASTPPMQRTCAWSSGTRRSRTGTSASTS